MIIIRACNLGLYCNKRGLFMVEVISISPIMRLSNCSFYLLRSYIIWQEGMDVITRSEYLQLQEASGGDRKKKI